MKNILYYLTGNPAYLLSLNLDNESYHNDEYADQLRKILGTSYKPNCYTLLNIYTSCPFINKLIGNNTLAYNNEIPTDNNILISTNKGPVSILPIDMKVTEEGPQPVSISIKYGSTTSSIFIYNDEVYQVKSNYADGVLYVDYPKDININGYIKIGANWNEFSSIDISVPGKYPVNAVDEIVQNLESLYDILIKANTIEQFYSADTAEERIAILVHTILLLTGYYE